MIQQVIAFLIVAAAFYGVGKMGIMGSGEGTQKGKKRSVRTVKVLTHFIKLTSNDQVFEAVGTGKARLSAEIYPAVSDEVLEVNFQAQDRVKKGQILVQLDDREEKLELMQAQVRLKDAKRLLDRYKKAVQEGAISQTERDAAQAAYDSALVSIDQAKLAIEERSIKAPFDGIVGIPNVDPGDRVNTGTMITGLDDRKVLHVDFEIPEALAGKLQEAQNNKQKIIATTPAFPHKTFEAQLSAQESRIDPRRRTLTARAKIDNSNDNLRPGMSFHTKWAIKGEEYPTVPEISLQWSRDGSFVWLIKDSKAVQTPVRIMARKEAMILVQGDIKPGDLVVVEGLQRLQPNLTVEVLGAGQ